MNSKYIAKTVNLPKNAADALTKAKEFLEQDMGLKLSNSQAIQVLATQYVNQWRGK